jgi:hypothetical protein
MRDTVIQKHLVETAEVDTKKSAKFNLTKWLRDSFNKRLNVPFYDKCCPTSSLSLPVKAVVADNVATLKYFDSTTEDWEEVSPIVAAVTATQITSKTTAVVANGVKGVITTVALTDALDTAFTFTLTNSKIVSTSVIQLTALNSGNGIAHVSIVSIATGSAVIRVSNVGVAAFNSLLKIHFNIT